MLLDCNHMAYVVGGRCGVVGVAIAGPASRLVVGHEDQLKLSRSVLLLRHARSVRTDLLCNPPEWLNAACSVGK